MTPAARRQAVALAGAEFGLSERRACALLGVGRSTVRYRTRRPPDDSLCTRLRTLAAERPRAGYRGLYRWLRREGWLVNHKRVHRLYRAEGLALRRRLRRKRTAGVRVPVPRPTRINERWSMDFMRDTLANGRAFRIFNVVDDCSREALAIVVEHSLPGVRVVRVLEHLRATRGIPEVVVCDNGPEFTGRALDTWAYQCGVRVHLIQPGKPVQNATVESFNGRLRDECLNQHWFVNLAEARRVLAAWQLEYNTRRPHSALADLTPQEFAGVHGGRSPAAPARAAQEEPNTTIAVGLASRLDQR